MARKLTLEEIEHIRALANDGEATGALLAWTEGLISNGFVSKVLKFDLANSPHTSLVLAKAEYDGAMRLLCFMKEQLKSLKAKQDA